MGPETEIEFGYSVSTKKQEVAVGPRRAAVSQSTTPAPTTAATPRRTATVTSRSAAVLVERKVGEAGKMRQIRLVELHYHPVDISGCVEVPKDEDMIERGDDEITTVKAADARKQAVEWRRRR